MGKKEKVTKEKGSSTVQQQGSGKGVSFRGGSGSKKGYNAVKVEESNTEEEGDTSVKETGSEESVGGKQSKGFGRKSSKMKKGSKKRLGSGKGRDSEEEEDNGRVNSRMVVAPLPKLSADEFEFFELVESGDVDEVKEFLESEKFQGSSKYPPLDINKKNQKGFTVLHLAVRRQDEAMVELLVKTPGILLYDTLLYAVKENNKKLVTLLYPEYQRKTEEDNKKSLETSRTKAIAESSLAPMSATSGVALNLITSGISRSVNLQSRSIIGSSAKIPVPGKKGSSSSTRSTATGEDEEFDSEFPSIMTPLMMAAQVGSEQLMTYFYQFGERLENINHHHNLGCTCEICTKLEGDLDLTRAYQRFYLLKAICQPDYICFLAKAEKIDPVNYALQKILKIREIISQDPAFSPLFETMEQELEEFISKLLELCRTTQEVEVFMSPKDPEEKERLPHLYPRLWYTTGLGLKDFISQPNAQTLVYKIWATDDWPAWESYNWTYRAFNLIIRLPAFPLIALFLLVAQETPLGRQLASPISRFLTYIASYIVFLCVVAFQSLFPYQRCNDHPNGSYLVKDQNCTQKGPPTMGTEWVLIVYVLSFYVSILKRQGVSWYWRMRWNWFELIDQLFFTALIFCWAGSYINYDPSKDIDIRVEWVDPNWEISGELCLSVAFLLACFRLLRFFVATSSLGPLLIRLGKQIVEFLGMGVILVVVVGAFTSGLVGLFVPYKDLQGIDEDDLKRRKKQEDCYTEAGDAFKTLFFALYEHGGPDTVKLLSWDVGGENATLGEYYFGEEDNVIVHQWTQWTALFLYVAYGIIGGTMVFGMIGGYFAHREERFEERLDEEWKYGRTELYLSFVKDTVVPPPFNLIPTAVGVLKGVKWLGMLGRKEDPKAGCGWRQCCFVTEGEKTKKWRKKMKGYRRLVVRLVWRWKSWREEVEGEEKASKDDVLEIAEELAEIKGMLKGGKEEEEGEKGGDGKGDDDDDDKGGMGGGEAGVRGGDSGSGNGGGSAGGTGGGGNGSGGVASPNSQKTSKSTSVRSKGSGSKPGTNTSLPKTSSGTTAQKSSGTTAQKSSGTTAQKSSGTTAQKSSGSTEQKSSGSTAQKSGKLSMAFIPLNEAPSIQRSSGLLDFSGFSQISMQQGINSEWGQQLSDDSNSSSTLELPPTKSSSTQMTPPKMASAQVGNTYQEGGTPQSTQTGVPMVSTKCTMCSCYSTQQMASVKTSTPLGGHGWESIRGSRGAGGLERDPGLKDFTGQGNEGVYSSTPPGAPTKILAYGDLCRPAKSTKQRYKPQPVAGQGVPPPNYEMTTQVFPREYTTTTGGSGMEYRRGSRGAGGLERDPGLKDFTELGNEGVYSSTPPGAPTKILTYGNLCRPSNLKYATGQAPRTLDMENKIPTTTALLDFWNTVGEPKPGSAQIKFKTDQLEGPSKTPSFIPTTGPCTFTTRPLHFSSDETGNATDGSATITTTTTTDASDGNDFKFRQGNASV